MDDNPHGLLDKQIRFCHEYIKDLNGARAYMRAGYDCMTARAAGVRACELLKKPEVKAYLGEILNLNNVSVVSEIAKIAFANITDVVDFDGGSMKIKPSGELCDRAKAAIQSIKFNERDTEDGRVCTVEVKMHDKLAALDKLMKKLQLYPKEMNSFSAVAHLLSQGFLTAEQAAVIIDGVTQIEEGLQNLSRDGSALTSPSPHPHTTALSQPV